MGLEGAALALRLGLAHLVLLPVGVGWLRPAIVGLAVAGLVLPRALLSPLLWGALAALTGARVLADWPLSDNHAYLLVYFCLAIACAPLSRDPAAALAWNARLLIGLAFLFAVAWKLASPDFIDGRFFRVTLLADPRLESAARYAGGIEPGQLREWRAFLTEPHDVRQAAPDEPARFRAVASAAGLAALGLEAAVALAFLWPRGRGLSRARDALLLAFCAATYAIAPVAGFGGLLLSMGLAQRDARQRWLPGAYLAVFALVFAYRALLAPGRPGA